MLSLLSSIYGKVANIRNRLYDRGVFKTFDLAARTISIGNITTGGTGKTPLVAYVAEILAGRGEKVCILTRGYGRANPKTRVLVSDGQQIFASPHEAGDEPFELAQKLLGKAIIIANADRVAAAELARRKFGVTAFLLDDGFQHRSAKRDVDIVCIDATAPFEGAKMLPAGRLREPLKNLKRADIIVITRSDLVSEISNLKSEILNLNATAPIFLAENRIVDFKSLEEFHTEMQSSQIREGISEKAFAFCGLGNPDNFFELLRRSGVDLVGTRAFRDHYSYTQDDANAVGAEAKRTGAEILVTTAKDAVKLKELEFEIPAFVVEIVVTIDDARGFAAVL